MMRGTVHAAGLAAAAVVGLLAVGSLGARLEFLHLHHGHETLVAHHHAYVGDHRHDHHPEAPERDEDGEPEGGQGTVSSLEAGSSVLPGTSSIGPTRRLRFERRISLPLSVPKAEPLTSAGPRAPPG